MRARGEVAAMDELPFAPTSLSAILADLVFLLILGGGQAGEGQRPRSGGQAALRLAPRLPFALRWLQSAQQAAAAYYRAHTTVGERQGLDGLASDAVAWAERYASSPKGEAKLKEAVAMVQAALDRRGIHVDVAEIEAAVQSAWADLRTGPSPAAPAAPPAPAPAAHKQPAGAPAAG